MAESPSKTGSGNRIRPEELIKKCQNRLAKHLLAYITPVFDNTIEALFQLADKGVEVAEQNLIFESQRILRNKKTEFTEQFSKEINENFDQFRANKSDEAEAEGEAEPELSSEMSLVDEQDLEESLAISDMVSKAEVRFTQSIYALNQRLAILRGGRPVKNDTNPCGPLRIGRALRRATTCLPVAVDIKVKLYHRFDRLVQKNLNTCYDEMNEALASAGILPNIRFQAAKRPNRPAPPRPQTPEQAQPPDAAAQEDTGVPGYADAPQVADAGPVAGGGHDFFGRALAGSRTSSGAAPAGAAQQPGAPGTPAAPQVPGQGAGQAGPVSFSSERLRQLMSSAAAGGHLPRGPVSGVAAPAPQLQAALSDLQSRLHGPELGHAVRMSTEEIKQKLADTLGKDPATGEPIALSEQHNQTIDIMGMLYEHIEREDLLQGKVVDLLHKLKVPMIRVALQEDEFLDDQEHPARQFFNSVAEAGELWLEDDSDQSPTLNKMETAIDHVLGEYRGDNEVFKQLLTDLDKHIQVLSRKATLAEKRHVEAARGQEKLEAAREQASRLVQTLLDKYNPPKFVQSVLSQPWCDVLALTVLRHGDDSDQWQEALKVAKTLIFSVRDDLDENVRANLRKRVEWLRTSLSKGLSQVGYFEQDVEALLANLEACHRWSLAEEKTEEQETPEELSQPINAPEPTAKAKSTASDAQEKKKKKTPKKIELNDKEKAMLAKIRLLPFGTWFELKLDDSGEWRKRKLSWYSPLTGRCLFVNNRGAVAEEVSLHQLAQMMAKGSGRIFRPNNKPLIDRAMDAIFGRLKKLAAKVSPT